jgi:transcriptional regulator with XRE-family HTH domain
MAMSTQEQARGARIRELRKRKGMTLQQLAAAIGRSVGYVSQLERGLSHPAVEDLYALSEAFGVQGSDIWADPMPPSGGWLVRHDARRTYRYAGGLRDLLASPDLSGRFFMLETVLEPGADSGERNLLERAEQGGYVLAGELALWLDDAPEPTLLSTGDSFQLASGRPCRYANLGSVPARVLWIYC